MNGACNLVCGSLNVAGGASEVNSWPMSESLLHSRQCELPFEISIFYAYTWETCRRTDAGAWVLGRAHDYPIPPRSEEEVYLRTYGECTQPRCICGGPEARTLSFLALGSVTTLAYACRALLAPTSSYYGPACASSVFMPLHAFGKWTSILSRDSPPSERISSI